MGDPRISFLGRDALIAAALAAVVIAAGVGRLAPGVCGVFHDDAIYVSTAQALAEGKGYRLIGVPGAPLQTKYPVLYPALLAAVWRAWPEFPDNLLAMQGLSLLAGAGAVGLSYLYLVRFGYVSRRVAAGAGLLCATSPYLIYFCSLTMSEMPFLLLLAAALWGLDRQLAIDQSSRRAQFGLGLLLALPFLCRTIGLAIIPAALLLLFRNQRPLRYCAAGATAATLPWIAWSLAAWGAWRQDPIAGYYTDYVGSWSNTGILLFAQVVRWNAHMIAHGTAEISLLGWSTIGAKFVSPDAWTGMLRVLGLLPWLAMIPHLRQGRALPWILGAYVLILLVWPWPPYRFLAPILPFLTAYLLAPLAAVAGRLPRWSGSAYAAPLGLGLLVLCNLVLLVEDARHVHTRGYPLRGMTDSTVAWSSYERVFAWLRDHSRPDDVLAAGMDSMFSLYTGRAAFRPFPYDPAGLFYRGDGSALGTAQDLNAILHRYRPRYLIHAPMPGFVEEKPFAQALAQLQLQNPDLLVPVFTDSDVRFTVFEVRIPAEESAAPLAATRPSGNGVSRLNP